MTKLKKILINATNLNEGGGVQVATSFLKDLLTSNYFNDAHLIIFVSPAVNDNFNNDFFDRNFFLEYRVVHSSEISFLNSYKLNDFDIVFTIFGPMFLPFYKGKHISGFAQPWIIYPDNDLLDKISFYMRWFLKIKYSLASYIFKQADILIVESINIKNILIKKGYKNRIEVVENAVSSIFFKEEEWSVIDSNIFHAKKINIGILSGGYPHKNLKFIIELAKKIELIYPEKFNFVFTLADDKFSKLTKGVSNLPLVNLGTISLHQCPSFYHQIDAIILPSLLECFSVTPFESIFMKRVIFLSDRDFFRQYLLDNAIYFDPLSVDSAINVMVEWFFAIGDDNKKNHIQAAYEFIVGMNQSSINKTNLYCELIDE